MVPDGRTPVFDRDYVSSKPVKITLSRDASRRFFSGLHAATCDALDAVENEQLGQDVRAYCFSITE